MLGLTNLIILQHKEEVFPIYHLLFLLFGNTTLFVTGPKCTHSIRLVPAYSLSSSSLSARVTLWVDCASNPCLECYQGSKKVKFSFDLGFGRPQMSHSVWREKSLSSTQTRLGASPNCWKSRTSQKSSCSRGVQGKSCPSITDTFSECPDW